MNEAESVTENEKLKALVAELEVALKEALAQQEAKARVRKRQAPPSSRGEKKTQPKRPGRKKGHKPAHRPNPDKEDRELDVPLKQSCCLHCGGVLSVPRIERQYQTDLPPIEPVVTRPPH